MTQDQTFTLIILLAAVILFASNRVRADMIALIVMVSLGLTGVTSADEAFSGFSSSAVMTILGISIISIALQITGATNSLSNILHTAGKGNEKLVILLVTLFGALVSLFMNNIAAVGVLLPAVMTLSRRSKISPSRLLLPLAYGTILGGMATLLTTSNIIVSGALKDAGLPYFGLLDYFPIGGPVMLMGILYLSFIGFRLLPAKSPTNKIEDRREFTEKLSDFYQVGKNLVKIELLPQSEMAGKTIANGHWYNRVHVNILAVLREKENIFSPDPCTMLKPGDILIARGKVTEQSAKDLNLRVSAINNQEIKITDEAHPLAEVIISPHSRFIGKSLQQMDFRERYQLNVVGVWRGGKPVEGEYADLSLHFGDALLVQGPSIQIRNLKKSEDLVVLEEDPDAVLLPRKGLLTIFITLLTLTIAGLGFLPVALVVMGGAVLLILTGCVGLNDAFRSIEWKAILLIAGLWPMSIALQSTGLAEMAVNSLLRLSGGLPPLQLAALFLFVAALLTQLMSGQVTAIVMIPLALVSAQRMGIDPRPFAMAVAMGCSLAFISPLGHPVNIIVMNPGGYTLKDYVKVGLPLTIAAFLCVIFAIKLYWGL